ncbi:hypothetical protein EIP91_003080 [Steccherinum ochraceum]|uniref:CRAL-TRIO domain-containing protein n=1 Tax=Steccherinum ochraceum TaxID=92696 RepID=A0A4R0RDH0_9APHY|nr:hypothetical protein EIP91_003080 [Steccherinum ochraceum]
MAPKDIDHDAVLQQFRQQLQQEDLLHDGDSIGTDDRTLSRFLRARNYNLKQAKAMWKACINWRNTAEGVGIDELYRRIDPWDYPERDHVFNCWPMWFHKTDKKGRPLNIHFFGQINMPELYKHISPERHWQTVLVNCESLTREVLPAATQAAGRPVDGTFVIVDLKGFSLSQFWQMKNLARTSFQVSQDYFPETMAQLAIVNAPSSFTTIWSFIKPWLAKETVAKVDVLGTDYQSVLLDLIAAENLPAQLGGSCTTCGADGCDRSNAGPWSEGRRERRERWLRGEGEIGVEVDRAVLSGGVRGTAEEDEEEREERENGSGAAGGKLHGFSLTSTLSRGSSKSAKSKRSSRGSSGNSNLAPGSSTKPIDIPAANGDADEELDASSQSTQASTPGPSTPPLNDITTDLSGLAIESSPSPMEGGLRAEGEGEGEDGTPTTPRKALEAKTPKAVHAAVAAGGAAVSVM